MRKLIFKPERKCKNMFIVEEEASKDYFGFWLLLFNKNVVRNWRQMDNQPSTLPLQLPMLQLRHFTTPRRYMSIDSSKE